MRLSSELVLFLTGLAGHALAHGDHSNGGERRSQKPIVDQNANWMTKHMAGKQYTHNAHTHVLSLFFFFFFLPPY